MFPGLDPSKMTPQVIAELSQLMRTLSPEQIMKMQTLMHNSMAGINIQNDVIEFEKNLPPTFREQMARIMYLQHGVDLPPKEGAQAPASTAPAVDTAPPANEREARLVILRSVAQGLLDPEAAYKVLFPEI